MNNRQSSIAVAAVTAVFLVISWTTIAADTSFSRYVDEDGSINFPTGFRTSMVHLGSWFVPEGGASGFHDVYTERESVEAYKRTGEFPDGATIVKELRSHESGTFTTGANVSYATTELKQWFVMIKDDKGRFADNPAWGEGWGWALYKPDDPETNVSQDYKTDCLGCHTPAKQDDWVYVDAYPSLSSD